MEEQFGALAQNPDILVATPGRLMHHLSEVEGMSLRSVEYVVFDEADRLFEMGFADQLRSILQHLADTRQVRPIRAKRGVSNRDSVTGKGCTVEKTAIVKEVLFFRAFRRKVEVESSATVAV